MKRGCGTCRVTPNGVVCLAQALRAASACRAVQSLIRSVEGREGLLLGLERAAKEDAPLRLQLELLLRPTSGTLQRKQTRELSK